MKSYTKLLLVLVASFGLTTRAWAQQSGVPGLGQLPTGRHAKAYVTGDPLFGYPTILGLIRSADLAVDATVEKVLPARLADPEMPLSIETDFILIVNQKFGSRGGVSKDHRIVISKQGGTFGGVELISKHDPPLQVGARYFLFLTTDDRSILPNIEGLTHYLVLGVWAGQFAVSGGKVQANKLASKTMHDCDGYDRDAFSDMIVKLGRRRVPLP